MLMRLGRVFNKRADVSIDPATRETIDLSAFAKQVNDQNVFETPLATTYGWVSGDGYPLANVHFDTKERRPNQCLIDFEYCLGQDFGGSSSVDVDTVDLFKRIAFELPHCGDCVVTALVGKSGDRGLEAFLPVAKKGKRPPDVGEVPAVGRGANWRTADFAIPNAARVSPRAWAVRAIQRYSYAFGMRLSLLAPPSLIMPFLRRLGESTCRDLQLRQCHPTLATARERKSPGAVCFSQRRHHPAGNGGAGRGSHEGLLREAHRHGEGMVGAVGRQHGGRTLDSAFCTRHSPLIPCIVYP